GVPALIQQLEEKVEAQLAEPRTVVGWPMPAEQPRFRFWPSSVRVNKEGIVLIAGMTVSRPGMNPSTRPPVVVSTRTIAVEDIPKVSPLQYGLSGDVLQGLTTVMMEAGVRSTDVRDLHPTVFERLTRRD